MNRGNLLAVAAAMAVPAALNCSLINIHSLGLPIAQARTPSVRCMKAVVRW